MGSFTSDLFDFGTQIQNYEYPQNIKLLCFKGKPRSINKLTVTYVRQGVNNYSPTYYNYDYDDSNISPTSFISKPILESLGSSCQFAFTCGDCRANIPNDNNGYVLKQANDDFKACSTAASQSAISAKEWKIIKL